MFSPPHDDPYRFKNVTAKEIGSPMRWLNSGFPNVLVMDPLMHGTERLMIFAADDISAGTPLVFSYGLKCHALSYGTQVLLRRDEMRQYFRQGVRSLAKKLQLDLEKIRRKVDGAPGFEMTIEYTGMEDRLFYPLQTPGALLDLHFSSIVAASEWVWLLDESHLDSADCFAKRNAFEQWVVRSFIKRIEEYQKKTEKHPEIQQAVASFVIRSIGNLSVMQILKLLSLVGNDVRKITAISDYLTEKESELKTYDWLQDDNAPLGFNRRREDMLSIIREKYGATPQSRKEVLAVYQDQYAEMAMRFHSKDHEELKMLEWVIDGLKKAKW